MGENLSKLKTQQLEKLGEKSTILGLPKNGHKNLP